MQCWPNSPGRARSSRSATTSTTGTISAGRTRWAAPKTPPARMHYGKSFGKRSVYTPQAVINGRTHVNGAKREAVAGALADMRELRRRADRRHRHHAFRRQHPDRRRRRAGRARATRIWCWSISIRRGRSSSSAARTRAARSPMRTPSPACRPPACGTARPVRFEFPQSEIAKKGGCAVLLQSVSKDGLPGPILGAAVISHEPETA